MSNWRILYWFVVGALFGVGYIALLSIGIFLLLPALALLIFGLVRFGGRRLWAILIGIGLAPAAILIWDVTSAPWACMPAGGVTSPVVGPGQTYRSPNYFQCVDTFAGPLTSYHILAGVFLAIALVGVIWGLIALMWRPSRRNDGPRHAAA